MRFRALHLGLVQSKLKGMTQHVFSDSRTFSFLCWLMILIAAPHYAKAGPSPAAVSAFNSYVPAVESRLAEQHGSPKAFLAMSPSQNEIELCRGDLVVEQLTPAGGGALPGALLHHWRGTAFAAGATAADFERLMRDFKAYPQNFEPEVLQARALAQRDDRFQVSIRVRQRHVITVVMDTSYDIRFGRLDARHGYSISQSTRVSEIDAAGTTSERPLNSEEEHGFLWRLNTYWSYEQRDDGLYMQIESVSLTRSIPLGMGWAVGPFVESVPRESLEFTLRSARNALRK
jgi:hypothetical protein